MRLTEALNFYSSNSRTTLHCHFVPEGEDYKLRKEYRKRPTRTKTTKRRRMKDIFRIT